ncbi:MAG: DNA replication and repair protein RecF [Bacteroidota bacterium]
MHLENISLFNFKNYEDANLIFSPDINCLLGENGSGKTNLLDAIHYLSLTKSALNSIDSQNIKHGEAFFSVKSNIEKEGDIYEVHCSVKSGQKKIFKVNKSEYEKISEHIGSFPAVLIFPNDSDIIRESSEARRKFFDAAISQINRPYLNHLVKYHHFLKQRNSLLKSFGEQNKIDKDLIEPYDIQLLQLGQEIFIERKRFVNDFLSHFTRHFDDLVADKEQVSIQYKSELLFDAFQSKYLGNLKRDLILQRTELGIHRDDFVFKIEDKPLKKFGSQGQQKSFLIALKLALFEIIKINKGFKPLLLLDDIFDKLDDHRIDKLVKMIASDVFGQIFITDARPERTRTFFKEIGKTVKFFEVEDGRTRETD